MDATVELPEESFLLMEEQEFCKIHGKQKYIILLYFGKVSYVWINAKCNIFESDG